MTPLVQKLIDCTDAQLAGGKAAALADLLRAGFPVPEGFVITTRALAQAHGGGKFELPANVARAVLQAYREMGAGSVAVRSSGTAEDSRALSMAGQYRTILNVEGEDAVLTAIRECASGIDAERVQSYLAKHGMRAAEIALAVLVQRLVPAGVAGVAFSVNPRTGASDEILIEAAPGLGEAVVSGLVQPDTVTIERETGAVKEATVADKKLWLPPGATGPEETPPQLRSAPSLDAGALEQLRRLTVRLEQHFGCPQDVEWAIHDGSLYVLQSRPVTATGDTGARERCLRDATDRLRALKREARGDWVRHNIGETLPHPTPLTWSVISHFMSGNGGFGAMYRQVGFEPSQAVNSDGFLELVCGKVYMDLSLAPEMFFPGYPYRYDTQAMRNDPDAAQRAPTIPDGSPLRLLAAARHMRRINRRIRSLAANFDAEFAERHVPAFTGYVEEEKARDLAGLDADGWCRLWKERKQRVLDDFGPRSLLSAMISATLLRDLRAFLAEHFWDDDPDELVDRLAGGGQADRTILAAEGLYRIAHGEAGVEAWMSEYGHRAIDEFDLSAPRWREQPGRLETYAGHLKYDTSPLARHRERAAGAVRLAGEIETRLPRRHRRTFRDHLSLLERYMRFREDGKYYLMMGYGLLRDMALEAGRRLEIGKDVFLLTGGELETAMRTGVAPRETIRGRAEMRAVEARLKPPFLIDEPGIDDLGAPAVMRAEDSTPAFVVSSGQCSGPARIVEQPENAPDLGEGYILVCPSSDPNWTPLFVNAAGIVMERGGTLSHGAVVAREMGIPAVVVEGAVDAFEEEELITIDAESGAVFRGLAQEDNTERARRDAETTRVPHRQTPPPPGSWERLAAAIRNPLIVLWGLYLIAAFLLPASVLYLPAMASFDALLLPLARARGPVAPVVAVALLLGVATVAAQRILTDNRRLLAAKLRAAALKKEAAKLQQDSPRRAALLRLVAPVPARLLGASFVPLALVLGPLMMLFTWFPQRAAPQAWNAAPGSTAYVTASIEGDYDGPVTLSLPPGSPLHLESPEGQRTARIRPVLEDLRTRLESDPAAVQGLPENIRNVEGDELKALLQDLDCFLDGPMPPSDVSWRLRTPDGLSGRFAVTLTPDGGRAQTVSLVLGHGYAPGQKETPGDGRGPVQVAYPEDPDSPVKKVSIVYAEKRVEGDRIFWAPLRGISGSNWDAGWLLTYIALYLPVVLVTRRALRVA